MKFSEIPEICKAVSVVANSVDDGKVFLSVLDSVGDEMGKEDSVEHQLESHVGLAEKAAWLYAWIVGKSYLAKREKERVYASIRSDLSKVGNFKLKDDIHSAVLANDEYDVASVDDVYSEVLYEVVQSLRKTLDHRRDALVQLAKLHREEVKD